jgi:hypothetical protein
LFEQETTEGAMRVLWRWIERYGIARALYTDHKNVYVADREPTVEEQLAGRPALTAFGKACHRPGIEIIAASSPQAKGRIERRHGVLQDRLVKELRLRGIKDLEAANEFLASEFLESVNGKFGHSAASPVDYHRPVPTGLRLEDVFVFEEQRSVQNFRAEKHVTRIGVNCPLVVDLRNHRRRKHPAGGFGFAGRAPGCPAVCSSRSLLCTR